MRPKAKEDDDDEEDDGKEDGKAFGIVGPSIPLIFPISRIIPTLFYSVPKRKRLE